MQLQPTLPLEVFWKGGANQLMANYNLSSKWSSWNFASFKGVDRLSCHLLTFIVMNCTPSIVGHFTKSQHSHGGTQQGDAQKNFNIRYGQGWQGANGTKGITHTHTHICQTIFGWSCEIFVLIIRFLCWKIFLESWFTSCYIYIYIYI